MLFILSVESLKLFLFWKVIYSYHPILLFRFLKHRVKNFFFFKSFFLSIPKVSTLPFRSFSYTIWGTFSSLAIIWNLYYKTRRAAQTASYAHKETLPPSPNIWKCYTTYTQRMFPINRCSQKTSTLLLFYKLMVKIHVTKEECVFFYLRVYMLVGLCGTWPNEKRCRLGILYTHSSRP